MSTDQGLGNFGAYQLLRRLAYGGMAEIFLAQLSRGEGFAKKVVVKRILPQFSSDSAFVQMFADEAVIAARLNHANIAQVYDFGDVDGVYYIAMEFIDGVDLRRLLQCTREAQKPLALSEALFIGEALARGLSYAHNLGGEAGEFLGIVHRDISPHNVMLSKSGDVKVMDFGIAKAAARVTQTAAGLIKGKVAYMAPEQAAGQTVDKRCDQFSLAVVVWECLTQQRLFSGNSDMEILRKVLACDLRPVSDLRPEVPPLLAEVLTRMLAKDPERRFCDLRDVETAFATCRMQLGREGLVSLGDLVQNYTTTGPGQKRQTAILAASPPEPTAALLSQETAFVRVAPLEDGEETILVAQTAVKKPGLRLWSLKPPIALFALLILVVFGAAIGSLTPGLVASLQVNSNPGGARVFINQADTGMYTPALLPGFKPGAEIQLGLNKDGFEPWRGNFVLTESAGAVTISLREVPLAIPMSNNVEALPPAPAPSAIVTEKSRPPKKWGTLSLRTAGAWAFVYSGEKKLGVTPLIDVAIAAGDHRLRLWNPELKHELFVDVHIEANAEIKRTVTFD